MVPSSLPLLPRRSRTAAATVASAVALVACGILPAVFSAPASAAAGRAQGAAAAEILDTTLPSGMRLKLSVPKGMDSSSYDSYLQNIYNIIITSNGAIGRYITPSDVVILCPPPLLPQKTAPVKGKGGKTAAQALQQLTGPVNEKTLDPNGNYTIYIMGRKFVAIDRFAAKAMGFADAKTAAFKVAKDCQQAFPRVCFRPPSLPDYNPPANPALVLTTNVARVVPQDVVARVELWGTPLMTIAGPQIDGSTPPDRAYMLSLKVSKVIGRRGTHTPDEVATKVLVAANPKTTEQAQVLVGTDVLFTFTAADAKVNKVAKAGALADKVATTIRTRLAESADVAAPGTTTPAPGTTTPPTTTPPTPAPADPNAPAPGTPAPGPGTPAPGTPAPAPAPTDPTPAPAPNPAPADPTPAPAPAPTNPPTPPPAQ